MSQAVNPVLGKVRRGMLGEVFRPQHRFVVCTLLCMYGSAYVAPLRKGGVMLGSNFGGVGEGEKDF